MNPAKVRDVADFGKYHFLNALATPDPKLALGVVWYLTSNSQPDGKEPPESLTRCDPELWEKLQRIPKDVDAVERGDILPTTTKYHSEPIPDNLVERGRWHQSALTKTTEYDLIFLDPDNGVWQWGERGKKGNDRRQYVLPEEIRSYADREQSVIIYQHLRFRNENSATSLLNKRSEIKKHMPMHSVSMVHYDVEKDVHVSFFVIPSQKHETLLRERARNLTKGNCWGRYFSGPFDL